MFDRRIRPLTQWHPGHSLKNVGTAIEFQTRRPRSATADPFHPRSICLSFLFLCLVCWPIHRAPQVLCNFWHSAVFNECKRYSPSPQGESDMKIETIVRRGLMGFAAAGLLS